MAIQYLFMALIILVRADVQGIPATKQQHDCSECQRMLHIYWFQERGYRYVLAQDGELDLRVMELHDVGTLTVSSLDGHSLDNMDLMRPDSVARGHLSVHLLNCAIERKITVLLEHVVVTCPGLVPKPHTVVLGLGRLRLEDLHSVHVLEIHPDEHLSSSGKCHMHTAV